MRRRLSGIGALAAAAAAVAGTVASVSLPSEGSTSTSVATRSAPSGLPAPARVLLDQERACTDREPDRFYEFYFTRAIYSEGGRGYRSSWSVDYPTADCQFIVVVKRLAGLDMFDGSYAITLDDPDIRRFPFLYILEVGQGMRLSAGEVEGLRSYLAAGGFLVVDDFWGTREWANFEREITRVFPDRPIVDLPMDHTLFRIFYDIDEVLQVPGIRNAERYSLGYSTQTWENDGYTPQVKGIYDDNGRLMVVINFNTDLGDAWEHADWPYYPLKFSTFAFEMGVNMILYSMTH